MNNKYVISRKDVCSGELSKTDNIILKHYDSNGNELTKEDLKRRGITNTPIFGRLICRGMLFNVNCNGLSNDLIYTSSEYPIEGIQPKIDIKSNFIIQQYAELDELLKYVGYGVDLTQEDLDCIFKTLVTHRRWLTKHMELFGWIKDSTGYHTGDNEAILPMSIYDSLHWISCSKGGEPYKGEPGYSFIKKIR
ncbi:MAG: hypothetical protein WC343_04015 [Bacilli bacterium]|jgi:hypothetical protein